MRNLKPVGHNSRRHSAGSRVRRRDPEPQALCDIAPRHRQASSRLTYLARGPGGSVTRAFSRTVNSPPRKETDGLCGPPSPGSADCRPLELRRDSGKQVAPHRVVDSREGVAVAVGASRAAGGAVSPGHQGWNLIGDVVDTQLQSHVLVEIEG